MVYKMQEIATVEEKILKWLSTEGYILELQVASAFLELGFSVSLANYYTDPNTNAQRQVDLIASIRDYSGLLYTEIIIECKKSREKPWVIFSLDNYPDDAQADLFEFALTSESARANLISVYDEFVKLRGGRYFGPRGIGVRQAFGKADIAFEALSGVMSASIARRKALHDKSQPMIFIFPIVIFDNQLFQCKFFELEINLQEISSAEVFFSNEIWRGVGCMRPDCNF